MPVESRFKVNMKSMRHSWKCIFGFLLLFGSIFSGCSYSPNSLAYQELYSHLNYSYDQSSMEESPYFLVILVEARHLDYTNPRGFFKTLAKHPSDGSKNGDVGHAWIYLQGILNGDVVCLEGGHSGELGYLQPRYVEGVFLRYEQGVENPISYLWESQCDGFFQRGPGRHYPTFAAKVDLTENQFRRILKFVECYDFSDYAITGNQCSSFAAQVGALAGVYLDCEVTMHVDSHLHLGQQKVKLWNDPVYSQITFSTPDILEKSLMKAVNEGKAYCALDWYKKTHPPKQCMSLGEWARFPKRYIRFKLL